MFYEESIYTDTARWLLCGAYAWVAFWALRTIDVWDFAGKVIARDEATR